MTTTDRRPSRSAPADLIAADAELDTAKEAVARARFSLDTANILRIKHASIPSYVAAHRDAEQALEVALQRLAAAETNFHAQEGAAR